MLLILRFTVDSDIFSLSCMATICTPFTRRSNTLRSSSVKLQSRRNRSHSISVNSFNKVGNHRLVTRLIRTPFALDVPFFLRRTITLAIKDTSCILSADVICVAAISTIHYNRFIFAPFVNMIEMKCRHSRDKQRNDSAENLDNRVFELVRLFQFAVHFRSERFRRENIDSFDDFVLSFQVTSFCTYCIGICLKNQDAILSLSTSSITVSSAPFPPRSS